MIDALTSSGAVATINDLNTRFEVAAGGFAGDTNPAYVYTVIDSGPNTASNGDIKVLTDSLGYVLSQGSAFLLDADNTASFDFPANYVVLNFDATPSLKQSAALFETVGQIDPELFETDTSGYTQYGRAYLSLQSAVPDEQYIAGYVKAAWCRRRCARCRSSPDPRHSRTTSRSWPSATSRREAERAVRNTAGGPRVHGRPV